MQIREIKNEDLKVVCELLAEGFPRRDLSYWTSAMTRLSTRKEVKGFPKFGYVLDINDEIQGVMLLLSSRLNGALRSNLSSWYVRESYRTYAAFMFKMTISRKGTTYLNLSPSAIALPIAEAFGFKAYTRGTLSIDPRALVSSRKATIKSFDIATLQCLEREVRDIVEMHLAYGCEGFVLHDDAGAMPCLFRRERFKRIVPAARFVMGDPRRLAASSGSTIRHLISRGIFLALLDRGEDLIEDGVGQMLIPDRAVRYYKFGSPPGVGDLLETELAVFGN